MIFGATGDLARRKLLPALYNLAHEGALPEHFHLVGVARKEIGHEDYRSECEEAIQRFSRRKPDEHVLKSLLENVRYVPGTFDEERVYSELCAVLERVRTGSRRAAEPRVLPVDRAELLPCDRRAARQLRARTWRSREAPRSARDHREAVRHDARGGARAQPPRAVDLRRDAGLPHRPLPRQGDRPEHAGVPLRQRHVRAAVEPQLHRQRADHRRGGHRHRLARRATTTRRARCAT